MCISDSPCISIVDIHALYPALLIPSAPCGDRITKERFHAALIIGDGECMSGLIGLMARISRLNSGV